MTRVTNSREFGLKLAYSFMLLQSWGAVLLFGSNVQMQTVKLRIGNPYDHGMIVTRMSSLNPRQLLTIEYLPPKGGRYFNGSLDVYVVPTDMVGLWATKLNENATDQAIDAVKGQAPLAFAEGKFSVWRIEQIKTGLTKVFLTVKELDPTTLALIPNGTIQAGSVPEITFMRWYDDLVG
jgi:hypothetical protein